MPPSRLIRTVRDLTADEAETAHFIERLLTALNDPDVQDALRTLLTPAIPRPPARRPHHQR